MLLHLMMELAFKFFVQKNLLNKDVVKDVQLKILNYMTAALILCKYLYLIEEIFYRK